MTAYEKVAHEYYDRGRHPTCANLRDGTHRGLTRMAAEFFGNGIRFCEVGCGEGMLRAMPGSDRRSIVGVDMSLGMLRHAVGPVLVADVMRLPFVAEVFDGVFGSLADPYNTPGFYEESWRVLREGGRLLFSVPDVRWVRHNQEQESVTDPVAIIRLIDGSNVTLPSHVYEPDDQIGLLGVAGFRNVECRPMIWYELPDFGSISHRFRDRNGELISNAVVTMYIGVK